MSFKLHLRFSRKLDVIFQTFHTSVKRRKHDNFQFLIVSSQICVFTPMMLFRVDL